VRVNVDSQAARDCFLRACELDVAVRKPGNVSLASPGHGMHAAMFIASAKAAAGPLFQHRARVGERIESAMTASWAAAGCNTNLGILLLCAPIAAAAERMAGVRTTAGLRQSIGVVLRELDVADGRAAFRAIALANPGGLGTAPDHDVRAPPSIGLRAAMVLAADRDLIARQYRDAFADLFDMALPTIAPVFSLSTGPSGDPPQSAIVSAVQSLYLSLLATFPDSHIVRKHGAAVAHNVMAAAQRLRRGAAPLGTPAGDAALALWDDELKSAGINPGTTADLTVAALLIAGVTALPDAAV
jgi:triphosphoribosyl-dephospho-CoA synthase